MKKNTLNTIRTALLDAGYESTDPLMVEIEAELNKGAEKAEANRKAYAEYHTQVMEALRSAGKPVTAQELADYTGISRGKIVYALTNYWADEVEKDTSGKSTIYSLKG